MPKDPARGRHDGMAPGDEPVENDVDEWGYVISIPPSYNCKRCRYGPLAFIPREPRCLHRLCAVCYEDPGVRLVDYPLQRLPERNKGGWNGNRSGWRRERDWDHGGKCVECGRAVSNGCTRCRSCAAFNKWRKLRRSILSSADPCAEEAQEVT